MKELDIAAFVKAERAPGEPDAAEQADVLARLEVTLGLLPPGSGPMGGGGGGGGSPGAGGARGLFSAGAMAKAGALLLAGFLAGAAVHAGMTRRPDVVLAAAASAPAAPLAPPVPSPSAAPSAELAAVALSTLPDAPSAAAPSAARGEESRRSDLDAERTLLETARTALVRGDSEHALAALARHRARFPGGQLREERESLNVYALVAANRKDEARAKAAEFRRSFPRSLQGPALDALVGAP